MKKALLLMLAIASLSSISYTQNITGHIWEDIDGNGLDDDGSDWDGVTVTLVLCSTPGVAVAGVTGGNPVTTDVDGEYEFTGIPDGGDYCIEVTDMPGGATYCTTGTPGDTGDSEADAEQTSEPYTAGMFMVPDDPDFVLDVGLYVPSTIDGEIYVDLNNDGNLDGSEMLLDVCVDVCIMNSDGTTAVDCDGNDLCETVTNGMYDFQDVPPGDYYLEYSNFCDIDCNGTSYTINAANAGPDNDMDESNGAFTSVDINVTSGGAGQTFNAGVYGYLLSTISGEAFEDIDDDGLFGGGDLQLTTCYTVCVINDDTGNTAEDCDGNQLCQTLGSGGTYEFMDNIPPGNYIMEFSDFCDLSCSTPPELGMSDGSDVDDASNDNDADTDDGAGTYTTPVFNVNDGTPDTWTNQEWDVDVGVTGTVLSTIEGEIWEDLNNDGIQGGGEPLLSTCVTVCVYDDATGAIALDCDGDELCVTTSDGTYQFGNNVLAGDYYVQFEDLCELCGGTSEAYFSDSDGGAVETNINDNDADGTNGGGIGMTTNTSPTFTVTGDDTDPDPWEIDAGVYGAGTISGEVWEDLNGNGVQDGGEPGIAGVEVCLELFSGGPAVDVFGVDVVCVTTDGGGNYTFENLPVLVAGENYKVLFDEDPNVGGDDYFFTTYAGAGVDPTSAPDDSDACWPNCSPANGCTNGFIIESCEDAVDVDAGYFRASTVGGRVFKDGDGDGCFGGSPDFAWDAPEVSGFVPGITVTINLAAGGGAVDVFGNAVAPITVTGTTADGVYCFEDLPPGDYVINFASPGAPWVFSERPDNMDPTANTPDCTDALPLSGNTETFDLESGEAVACGDLEEVNLGLYKLLTIGGLIFNDADADCVQNGAEGFISNVSVIIEGTGCPGGGSFGPVTVENDILTGEWILEDMVPPCDCIQVSIDPDEFDVSTGALGNHETCGTGEAWDEGNAGGITNNGNGSNPNVQTDCIPMYCGIIPDNDGMALLTIDFGLYFECTGSTTTPLWPDCETSEIATGCNPGDFNYICDIENLNNYCGTMEANATGSGPSPTLCPSNGGGVSHNTYWISFIAGDDAACFDLDLEVGNCTGGGGVQWGIVSNCDHDNVICDGACTGNSTYNIVTDLLEPGEQYYLWVDGCNNDVCDIQFTLNCGGGTFDYPDVEVSECDICLDGSDPDIHDYFVCTGASAVMFCVDDVNAFYSESELEFYWNIDNVVDGVPSNEDTDGNLGFIEDNCFLMDFSDTALYPAGDYELCMTFVGTCCDNEGPLCMAIHIEDQAPETYEPIMACWDADFPIDAGVIDPLNPTLIGWGGNAITDQGLLLFGPDVYNVTATDFPIPGCTVEQSIEITDLSVGQGILNDVICDSADPFEYVVGQDLSVEYSITPLPTGPGGETVTWPGEAANGCDSILNVNIQVIELEGFITETPCTEDGITLSWENTADTDPMNDYFNTVFTWKKDGVEIADTDGDITDLDDLMESGTYQLCIKAELFSDFQNMFIACTWESNEIVLDFTQYAPPTPDIDTDDLNVCADNAMGQYCIDPDILDEANVIWAIANGGVAEIVGGQGQECVNIDWTGSTGGTVVALISSVCGEAENFVVVAVVESPIASIAPISDVCVNTSTTIEYDGLDNPGATYVWNTPNGTFMAGTSLATGPGPHTVSWSTPGVQMVTLQVQDGDCISTEVVAEVNIIAPPLEPTITCSESSTEIVFTVNDPNSPAVLGNYVISHTPAIGTGVQAGNEYTVSGLTPGQVVTISVDYEDTSGFCPGGTVMGMCTAQNCTDPGLFFDAVPDICFDATAAAFNLNAGSATGLAGTSTFDGPGITDATVGTFDPSIAGVGTHVINLTYNTTLDNCNFFSSIMINVVEQPRAVFTVDSPVCLSDPAVIEFDNTSGGITPTSFTWDIGSAIAPMTGLNGAGPHSITFPDAGTYMISLTTSVLMNGGADECISETMMMEIVVDDQIADPVISCQQTTSSVLFTWTEDASASGYVTAITAPSYATIVEAPGSADITDLNENDVVEITVTATSANSCPDGVTTIDCQAIACQFTAVLVDDVTLCDGAPNQVMSFSLSDPTVPSGSETYTWTINTPTGAGIDPVTGEVDANAAGSGNWTATLTILDGDCMWEGDADVTILPGGTPVVTQIGPFCETDAAVMLMGEVQGASLSNPVVTWTGTGVTGANNDMFDPSISGEGTFTIDYLVVDDNCTYGASIEVVVDPELAAIEISCQPSDDMVIFTWNDDPCAASYDVTSSVPGTLDGTTYTVMNLTEGQQVDIIVIMVSDCECSTPPVDASCTANPCPQITISLDQPFTELCQGSITAPFSITPDVVGSNGTGVGSWSGGVDQNGMFDPNQGPGVYDITYEFIENDCPFSSTTTVEILENPSALVMVADPVCYQDNLGTIMVDPSGGSGLLEITIDGATVNANESTPVTPSSHTIEVTDENGCTYVEVISVEAAIQPPLDIEGDLNQIFPNSLEFTYNSTVINVDSIVWTLSDSITVCSNCTEVSLDGIIDNEELCATLYFNDGCTIEDCKTVSIRQVTQVFFPNIISPNGDDINDNLIIGSNAIQSVDEVYVYDRWGELIKSDDDGIEPLNDPSRPNEWILWDGTFKGEKAVVPGVYVFVIKYTDSSGDPVVEGHDVTVIEGKQ